MIRVGRRFTETRNKGESAAQVFTKVYDEGINFTLGGGNASGDCIGVTSGGCTSSKSQINFWSMAGHGDLFIMMGNVIHELGHAYNHALHEGPINDMPYWMPNARNLFLEPNSRAPIPNACDDCPYYQYDRALTPTETFADMFVAWTLDVWNTSTDPQNVAYVTNAQNWLSNWLP